MHNLKACSGNICRRFVGLNCRYDSKLEFSTLLHTAQCHDVFGIQIELGAKRTWAAKSRYSGSGDLVGSLALNSIRRKDNVLPTIPACSVHEVQLIGCSKFILLNSWQWKYKIKYNYKELFILVKHFACIKVTALYISKATPCYSSDKKSDRTRAAALWREWISYSFPQWRGASSCVLLQAFEVQYFEANFTCVKRYSSLPLVWQHNIRGEK